MAKSFKIIVALLAAALLSAALWHLSPLGSLASKWVGQPPISPGVTVTSDSFPPSAPVHDGLREYQNLLFRFTLWVPVALAVKEYSAGNTTTMVFEDPKTSAGFQIFAVPYKGDQISDARFKMDVPSGVRNQPTDIIVDGTPATMFYSTSVVLGDDREVWFIKNGFLYEVTTYKELDTWLAGIMTTWRFI